MQHKRLKLSVMLILVCAFKGLKAQESMNTTGGNALGSGGSVSYSIGQVVYNTNEGSGGSSAQGVQQPYEISAVIGIEEVKNINLLVTTYPNPANDYLTLEVKDFEISNLYYLLYDIHGNLLRSEKITMNSTSIFVSNLLPATYFVKVVQGDKEVRTFKKKKK